MPSASERTAIEVKPGLFARWRTPNRMSRKNSASQANAQPQRSEVQSLPDHEFENSAGLRPERHPNADLARALRHCIGHHAKNADGRQRERQQSETAQQRGGDARREERHSHVFDHRLDAIEWQGSVELLKLPANIRDRALWLARRARDHCQGAADPRAHVGVDERRGSFVQTEVFAVLDYPDDLDPRSGGTCVAETFAKGRLARPETARKGLVDHGDILLRLAILLREIAALY